MSTKTKIFWRTLRIFTQHSPDIDALVLFANGFEDIIQPSENEIGLCHQWQRMPKEKDFLATTVAAMKMAYDVAGCRLSREYLTTTHLQWHRENSLFEPCNMQTSSYQCICDRLQRIVPKSALGRVTGPGDLEGSEKGAVIFGQASRTSERKSVANNQANGFYLLQNGHLDVHAPPHYSESDSSDADDSIRTRNPDNNGTSGELGSTSSQTSRSELQYIVGPSRPGSLRTLGKRPQYEQPGGSDEVGPQDICRDLESLIAA